MVLACLDAEIDEVSGMGDDSTETGAQRVAGESLDILPGQRLCKPLHIVLHKDLNGRASDTDSPVNGLGDAADRRNMGTDQGKKDGGGFLTHRDEREEGGLKKLKG